MGWFCWRWRHLFQKSIYGMLLIVSTEDIIIFIEDMSPTYCWHVTSSQTMTCVWSSLDTHQVVHRNKWYWFPLLFIKLWSKKRTKKFKYPIPFSWKYKQILKNFNINQKKLIYYCHPLYSIEMSFFFLPLKLLNSFLTKKYCLFTNGNPFYKTKHFVKWSK